MPCRSLHWERGLKLDTALAEYEKVRRSLHWERGLKQKNGLNPIPEIESLPSLGAWIETTTTTRDAPPLQRRSLHWERGLKLVMPG